MKKLILLLVGSFFTIGLQAQKSEITGARSWNIMSSLIGKTVGDAKSILQREGMTKVDQGKDKDLGLEYYSFFSQYTKDKDEEPNYFTYIRNDKVVLVMATYHYDEQNATYKSDIAEFKKTFRENGYIQEKIKTEPGISVYKNGGKNLSAAVYADPNFVFFEIVAGDPKLLLIHVNAP